MCEHDPEIAEAALWAITNMACDLGLAKVTNTSELCPILIYNIQYIIFIDES